jgi:hypothetical protein
MHVRRFACAWLLVAACGDDQPSEVNQVDARVRDAASADAGKRDAGKRDGAADAAAASIDGLTLRANVQPVTRVEDALPGAFIPPFVSCLPPREGEPPGNGPDGKVCTNVMISGCTEENRYFADYASCDIVLTQRPFWSRPPAGETKPDDPRLNDQAYLAELGWVTDQVKASGCVCCHDSQVLGKQAGQWDIRLGPLWLDSLSDSGLALFTGLADSSVLGAYHAKDNNGFDRSVTGIPTTDNERMRAFMLAELERRGISVEEASAVPPFGGPIYANRVALPEACAAGEGVLPDGTMIWNGPAARYLYVLREDSENPGVPPNFDLPEGTLFKLDVLPNQPALASGVAYGTTPTGSFQAYPESTRASPLVTGTRYHFYVLKDAGIPLANCLFTFGEEPPEPEPPTTPVDSGAQSGSGSGSGSGATCTLAGGDAAGFGAPCKLPADCTCEADYCALMPGQATGYCTKQGCKQDASLCPSGWSCFDLSLFSPDLPAICTN